MRRAVFVPGPPGAAGPLVSPAVGRKGRGAGPPRARAPPPDPHYSWALLYAGSAPQQGWGWELVRAAGPDRFRLFAPLVVPGGRCDAPRALTAGCAPQAMAGGAPCPARGEGSGRHERMRARGSEGLGTAHSGTPRAGR